jgi:hypothetical protein
MLGSADLVSGLVDAQRELPTAEEVLMRCVGRWRDKAVQISTVFPAGKRSRCEQSIPGDAAVFQRRTVLF